MSNKPQVRATADDERAGHAVPGGFAWWLRGHGPFADPDSGNADRARHKAAEGAPEPGVQFEGHATVDQLTDSICRAIRNDLVRGLEPYGLTDGVDDQAIFDKAREVAQGHHASVHEADAGGIDVQSL